MFLPFRDDNPRHYIKFYYVTFALIATNVLLMVWELTLADDELRKVVLALGMIPSVVQGNNFLNPGIAMVPAPLTFITSMFLHSGPMHLLGNMLFLWVFGDNVEDAMGHWKFLAFYLISGLAAAMGQAVSDPFSDLPMIGASGAISGVLGAYLILHPRVKIWTIAFLPIVLKLPTYVVLGGWIIINVINAIATQGETGGGTAWWAHLGGLVAGMVLVKFFKRKEVSLLDWKNDNNQPVKPRPNRSRFPDSGDKN